MRVPGLAVLMRRSPTLGMEAVQGLNIQAQKQKLASASLLDLCLVAAAHGCCAPRSSGWSWQGWEGCCMMCWSRLAGMQSAI